MKFILGVAGIITLAFIIGYAVIGGLNDISDLSKKGSIKKDQSWIPTRQNRSDDTIHQRVKYTVTAVDYNNDGKIEMNEIQKQDTASIIWTIGKCENQIIPEKQLMPTPKGFAYNPITGEYVKQK